MLSLEEKPTMATITVLRDDSGANGYRAIAGDKRSTGPTMGQALDALAAEIGEPKETTLIVVQPTIADDLFPEHKRRRLAELMARWRTARDAGQTFSATEQAELDALATEELRAAGDRAAALLRQVVP